MISETGKVSILNTYFNPVGKFPKYWPKPILLSFTESLSIWTDSYDGWLLDHVATILTYVLKDGIMLCLSTVSNFAQKQRCYLMAIYLTNVQKQYILWFPTVQTFTAWTRHVFTKSQIVLRVPNVRIWTFIFDPLLNIHSWLWYVLFLEGRDQTKIRILLPYLDWSAMIEWNIQIEILLIILWLAQSTTVDRIDKTNMLLVDADILFARIGQREVSMIYRFFSSDSFGLLCYIDA